MKRFLSDDSGAVVVIVAVVLVALLGVAAIAVDQGYLYDTRRQLQAAADAASLAGCSVLIESKDPGQAEAAAYEYAAYNANGPGEGLVVDSVEVDMSAEPWWVRVRVSRPVPAWFAGVFGVESTTVHAVGKAEKQPLVGARNLMPWGLPIIREDDVADVEAIVMSGATALSTTTLSSSGAHRWAGNITAPTTPGAYDVNVAVVTEFAEGGGITEWVGDSKGPQPAGRIIVAPTDYPFTSIQVTGDYGANDESFAINVTAVTKEPAPSVTLAIDKQKVSMTGSGTNWSVTLTDAQLAYDDGFLDTFPLDLYVGSKADTIVDAYAHIRRSTYPFKSVVIADNVVAPGGSVPIEVELNDFDPTVLLPGAIFTLKVGSDGVETGNFCELNYGSILHDGCPPDPEGADLGNNVRDWVEEGYGGGVHVGDIVPASPGNSGWTVSVVQDRIAEFGDVIVVPVVSKYEDKGGGTYDTIVRAFAAFRITVMEDKSTIRGEFIEYVANPHEYGSPGGPGVTVFQARLVNP